MSSGIAKTAERRARWLRFGGQASEPRRTRPNARRRRRDRERRRAELIAEFASTERDELRCRKEGWRWR